MLTLLLACLGLALPLSAQKGKQDYAESLRMRPHELAGFLLHQDQKAFDAALGNPFQEQEGPNSTRVRAYHLPGSKKNYLAVFFFVSKEKDSQLNGKAVQMELTGSDPMDSGGFFGLRLGDGAEQVEQVLGKPTEMRHEKEEDLYLWDYKENNYTLEFTPEHKLYSIQIIDQAADSVPALAGSRQVRELALAVEKKDWLQVQAMISGEMECYVARQYYSLQAGAVDKQLADPKNGATWCLQKAAKAILALGPEMQGTSDEIRMWTKHTPGTVTKFPISSPLQELVFVNEAGAFRVYEVTFR
jgi:hypothetical protein